jgi:putative intracellular protease/amidase
MDIGYEELQLLDPAGLFRLAAHDVHAVAPEEAENFPIGQAEHVFPLLYFPAVHTTPSTAYVLADTNSITKRALFSIDLITFTT